MSQLWACSPCALVDLPHSLTLFPRLLGRLNLSPLPQMV